MLKRSSILILLALATLATACSDSLPYEPVPCHGYAPYDSLVTHANGAVDTLHITLAHVCGAPRTHS